MIKYVFSDIDGTILNNKGEVTKYTKELIRESRLFFTLVSARSPQKMDKIIDELGIGGIHIAFNGAIIFKRENDKNIILNSLPLDYNFVKKLIFDIRGRFPNIGISLYDEKSWNVDLVNSIIEQEKRIVHVDYNLVNFNDYFASNEYLVYKVSFIENDIDIFNKLIDYMRVNYSQDEISVQKSLSGYLEITHANAQKAIGIEYIMNLHNIKKENALAFGDGQNDLSMFKSVGYAIAMENASDEVKKYANFITKSNIEDGVAYALENVIKNIK